MKKKKNRLSPPPLFDVNLMGTQLLCFCAALWLCPERALVAGCSAQVHCPVCVCVCALESDRFFFLLLKDTWDSFYFFPMCVCVCVCNDFYPPPPLNTFLGS